MVGVVAGGGEERWAGRLVSESDEQSDEELESSLKSDVTVLMVLVWCSVC